MPRALQALEEAGDEGALRLLRQGAAAGYTVERRGLAASAGGAVDLHDAVPADSRRLDDAGSLAALNQHTPPGIAVDLVVGSGKGLRRVAPNRQQRERHPHLDHRWSLGGRRRTVKAPPAGSR
jgi:hypothetical protein